MKEITTKYSPTFANAAAGIVGAAPSLEKFSKASRCADLLNVNPKTIRRWAADAKISAFKIGRTVLYHEASLVSLVESGRLGADAVARRNSP